MALSSTSTGGASRSTRPNSSRFRCPLVIRRLSAPLHNPRAAEMFVTFVFLLPTVLVLGTFSLYPAVYSLFLSFFQWDGFSPHREFVGFAHYIALAKSPEFWNSLRVTLLYSVGVTIGALAFGLAAAVLLHQKVIGRSIYRALFFLPIVTPTVATGVVWKYLLDPTNGAINSLLRYLGISGPSWLSDPRWALIAVIGVGIWKRTGFNAIIYLAALQGIPKDLIEAAMVDGANPWRSFWSITWPLLRPATFFVCVTSLIDAFQAFDLVYVMTEGGPLGATDVLGHYLYRYGFRYSMLGYSSAVSYVIFIVVLVITLVQFHYSRRGGYDL